MRPIDFCTPKPFQLEHLCSAVSQRCDRPVRPASFVACFPRATLVPEPCGSVLVPANVFFACCLTRPKTCEAGTGWLGAFRCENEAGENLASRRDSHFGDRTILTRWRYLPPCEIELPTASDTPVASSVPLARARFSSNATHRLGGRQDRFRGGLVKGVRFTDPGCLPPTDATRIPPAPKRERNRAAFIEDAALT